MRASLRHTVLPLVIAGAFVGLLAASGWDAIESLAPQDTDDAMRLVQGRDLAGEQSWGDLTQHRLNPPGVPMHWSRHLDLVVASSVSLLGTEAGLVAASLVVPWLSLAGLLAAVGWAADGLGERRNRWLMMLATLTSAAAFAQFWPGRVDHHGLQIALVVGGSAALIHRRWVLGGALVGSALAVGLDALPAVAGLFVAIGLAWVVKPAQWSATLARTPGALVAAAVAGTVVFAPDGRLFSTACDVLSLPFAGALALAAGGLWGIQRAAPSGRIARAGLLAGAGAAAAAGFLLIRPACLSGPYADVPPDMAERWLGNLSETRSIVELFADRPLTTLAIVVPTVVALAMVITDVAKGRPRLVAQLGLLAGAALVVPFQFRGLGLATGLALPPLVLVLAALQRRRWPGGRLGAGIATITLLLVATGFVPLAIAQVVRPQEAGPGSDLVACSGSDNLAVLGEADPGLALAHIDLGPAILLHSELAVLGAPYHRNTDGIRATYELLDAHVDGTDLARAGIDYVVVCPAMRSNDSYTTTGPTSLMARLLAGEPVDGIEQVAGETVLLFEVGG